LTIRFWELADMVEWSSAGHSGNWARHWNLRSWVSKPFPFPSASDLEACIAVFWGGGSLNVCCCSVMSCYLLSSPFELSCLIAFVLLQKCWWGSNELSMLKRSNSSSDACGQKQCSFGYILVAVSVSAWNRLVFVLIN
jgi:hypothetical protein